MTNSPIDLGREREAHRAALGHVLVEVVAVDVDLVGHVGRHREADGIALLHADGLDAADRLGALHLDLDGSTRLLALVSSGARDDEPRDGRDHDKRDQGQASTLRHALTSSVGTRDRSAARRPAPTGWREPAGSCRRDDGPCGAHPAGEPPLRPRARAAAAGQRYTPAARPRSSSGRPPAQHEHDDQPDRGGQRSRHDTAMSEDADEAGRMPRHDRPLDRLPRQYVARRQPVAIAHSRRRVATRGARPPARATARRAARSAIAITSSTATRGATSVMYACPAGRARGASARRSRADSAAGGGRTSLRRAGPPP